MTTPVRSSYTCFTSPYSYATEDQDAARMEQRTAKLNALFAGHRATYLKIDFDHGREVGDWCIVMSWDGEMDRLPEALEFLAQALIAGV